MAKSISPAEIAGKVIQHVTPQRSDDSGKGGGMTTADAVELKGGPPTGGSTLLRVRDRSAIRIVLGPLA